MKASPSLPRPARARRRPAMLLALLLLAAAAVVPFIAHGAGHTEVAPRTTKRGAKTASGHAEYVPGHVLVRFRDDLVDQGDVTTGGGGRTAGHALVLDAGGSRIDAVVERFEGSDLVPGLRLAYVAPEETLAAVEALNARADVLYAEPDYVRRTDATPNDPSFAQLYAMTKISAPAAWDRTTGGGANVVVGIVDEGVDVNHPDLAANIWTNPGEIAGNGVDDDGDGKVDDVHGWDFTTCTGGFTINTAPNACGNSSVYDGPGIEDPTDNFPTDGHGTHVAGTIGAVGNNGTGVAGVNWNVRMMPLKFIDGVAGTGSTSNAIRAEAYAKAMRDKWVATGGAQGANVRVLNNSYGGGGSSQAELDAIRAVGQSGILFVVAAGNESSNNDFVPAFPANYDAPNLIAVASSTSGDTVSSFSNFGSRLVTVAAPGSSIFSTIARTNAAQTYDSNGYAFLSGTSMATPHVAGLAALLCALNPQIDVLRLRSLIAYNGDAVSSVAGKVYTQRRINALASVLALQENDTTAPAAASNLQVSAQTGRAVTVNFNAPGDDGNSGTAALYEISFVSGASAYVLKTAVPNAPGTPESFTVNVPLRQTAGSLRVRTLDNAGNESSATVGVTVDSNAADPYVPTEAANGGLAPVGTAQGFHADDGYRTISLPAGFSFPYFGQQNTSVVVSSNGNLYLQPLSTLPPANGVDLFGDSLSSTQQLEGFRMVAGLWDDLRTDCTGNGTGNTCDVYVNTSDPNKVVFRWEARTFVSSNPDAGNPVEFEIELNHDGTIRERYGAGNVNVFPVVGIGAGEQGGAYVSASHTNTAVSISLTNAQTVTFTPRPAGAQATTVQFSAANFNTSEDDTENTPRATVIVTRAGDTSVTSSVTYRTVDDQRPIRCDDTSTAPGVSFARCDYATVVGTLTFAPGETQKLFTIPIIDDSFVEGQETFTVQLSNAKGATLGTPSSATVTIFDNDTFSTANPIFQTDFFVRQQYLDFLSREPEAGQPWSAVINNCPSGDTSCDRVSVSANFFRSQEFELKGRFVFRFYKVAFGRLPFYSEIVADMASVTGTTTAEVQQKKAAFTNDFTQRAEFKAAYDSLTNQQFVDTLMNRYSLQSITTPDPANPDGTTKVVLTRTDLVNRLNAATMTRAQVLRAVSDSDQVAAAEFNSAFVAMQYFGYLRRDPDTQGYNAWLATINANPNDFRAMVNGFVNSPEYRLRFGQP